MLKYLLVLSFLAVTYAASHYRDHQDVKLDDMERVIQQAWEHAFPKGGLKDDYKFSRPPITENVDFDCTNKTGHHPHPTDCTRFILCHRDSAIDMACCDCNNAAHPEICVGSPYFRYNKNSEFCEPPNRVPCDGHTCEGRVPGGICNPNLPEHCVQCGVCVKQHQFAYIRCDAEERDDPRENVTGIWVEEECSEKDFFNPADGGQCTGNWDDLSEEVQNEYRDDEHCYPHEVRCEVTGPGSICKEVNHGDVCDPKKDCNDCGRCEMDGSGRFSWFECVGEQQHNPLDPWVWTWRQTNCSEGEFFNPSNGRGRCSDNWETIPEELKKEYRECFGGPDECPETDEGTICDDTENGSSCNLGGVCSCGRCDGNGQFSYFTCEATQNDDPREGWYGNWSQTLCQNASIYNPSEHNCQDDWETVVEWARKIYKEDEKCFPDPDICLEWEEAPCSQTYHAKEPGKDQEKRQCSDNRFFSDLHKNCKKCDEVVNQDGSGCKYDNKTGGCTARTGGKL